MKHGMGYSWDFEKGKKYIYVYISTHVQTYASTLEKPESCSSLLIRNKRIGKEIEMKDDEEKNLNRGTISLIVNRNVKCFPTCKTNK